MKNIFKETVITGASGKQYEPMDFTPPPIINQPPTEWIDTINFIESKELNYHLGNVIKYISRHKNNTLEDLEKAQWHLSREIDRIKNV